MSRYYNFKLKKLPLSWRALTTHHLLLFDKHKPGVLLHIYYTSPPGGNRRSYIFITPPLQAVTEEAVYQTSLPDDVYLVEDMRQEVQLEADMTEAMAAVLEVAEQHDREQENKQVSVITRVSL